MTVLSNVPGAVLAKTEPCIDPSGWPTAWLAIAVFSLMSVTMAVISQGFLEGDACSHFLTARAAFANPAYLVNVWGRPFCTGLYALPAHYGGRLAVRLTSLMVAIAIALITRSIASYQGWRWPTLGLIFLLAQPLVFLHSFSELTELPFALLVALGFWAYQRRQFLLMAVVMGLGPLSRPEGFGFLGLALLALLLHRRWWWSVVLLMPVVLWDYFGWRLNGYHGPWWHWLRDNWPYAQESLYERGPLLYFVSVMPAVVSPFIFPATVVGGWLCLGSANVRRLVREAASGTGRAAPATQELRNSSFVIHSGIRVSSFLRHSAFGIWISKWFSNIKLNSECRMQKQFRNPNPRMNDECRNPNSRLESCRKNKKCGDINKDGQVGHLRRCEVLIAVLPLLILIGHSLLYWRGKMASNGEVRYMMVVAPFWALLSARGWTWIFREMNWTRPLLWAAFAAMVPVLVNRAWTVIPMDNSPDWLEAQQIAIWYKTPVVMGKYPHLLISHVGLQYSLNLDPESGQVLEWKKSVIDARPPGTLLIWDRVGALFNSDAQRKIPLEEIRSAGWKPLRTRWTKGAGEWRFFVSE